MTGVRPQLWSLKRHGQNVAGDRGMHLRSAGREARKWTALFAGSNARSGRKMARPRQFSHTIRTMTQRDPYNVAALSDPDYAHRRRPLPSPTITSHFRQ